MSETILQRLYNRLGWTDAKSFKPLSELRREAAQCALEDHGGKKCLAALALGISGPTLNRYLRGLGVLILFASTASAQIKGATALLNLVSTPSKPIMSAPLQIPSASMAAQPVYQDRSKISLKWQPQSQDDSYNLYWGSLTGTDTNVLNTTKTNITVAVPEGGIYWFSVRAVKNLNESVPSNTVVTNANFYGDLTHYIFMYRTRGKSGVTNRVQESTTPTGPWVTTKLFFGTGAITNVLSTNQTQRYFRTVAQ